MGSVTCFKAQSMINIGTFLMHLESSSHVIDQKLAMEFANGIKSQEGKTVT